MEQILTTAHNAWRRRPPDQKFFSLQELQLTCESYKNSSVVRHVKTTDLCAIDKDNEILVNFEEDIGRLTHWAFSQLCSRATAPSSYLRTLPANLVTQCLNYGLGRLNPKDKIQLLYHNNEESILCRSFMTQKYVRIWDYSVCNRLLELEPDGWTIPPAALSYSEQIGSHPATTEDVAHSQLFLDVINEGDSIVPEGLYASDHDLFVFMVDPTKQINDGTGEPLFRGFFCWNSEVGSSSIGIKTFLYRKMCRNHMLIGATNIQTFRGRHVGTIESVFDKHFQKGLKEYAESSAEYEEDLIKKAQELILGKTKEEVVEALVKTNINIGKKILEDAFEEGILNEDEDGDPHSLYGMINALTRLSQDNLYTDERTILDSTASKLIRLVQ